MAQESPSLWTGLLVRSQNVPSARTSSLEWSPTFLLVLICCIPEDGYFLSKWPLRSSRHQHEIISPILFNLSLVYADDPGMMAFIPPTRLPFRVNRRHSVCTQTPRALLPAQPPILLEDLDNLLTSGQKSRLETTLRTLDETDTHLRVLTQNAANTPGRAVIQIFGLSEETALIVADTRGGNLLNFRVGESLQKRLPLSFWTELGNRYGNKFYVDEHGPDGALLDAVDKIKECSGRVCNVVPGISNDQLYVDIACAAIGGAVAGAASRTGGKKFNVSYLALFSPLWGIFLVSFGLGPVLTRVPTVSPEVGSVVAAFLAVALLVWAWVPARFGRPGQGGN